MDTLLLLTLTAGFVAVVLAIMGAYLVWSDHRSPEMQRLSRRRHTLTTQHGGREMPELLKRRHAQQGSALEQWLQSLPRLSQLEQMIEQAGLQFGVSRLLMLMAACGAVVLLPLLGMEVATSATLALGLLAAAAPLLWVSGRRTQRLKKLEEQLPEVIDLMARALRAGHAFPSALQMAGEESPDPIGMEFRLVNDEINFGVPHDEALRHLTRRVPLDDLRFFVIAVLLQRETGGNLAEVLLNIARLIRSRFRLFGKVRALAAEGLLSGWILGLLPVGTGIVMYISSPEYIMLLWSDPSGFYMSSACLALLGAGALWMRRIVRIRV